MSCRRLHRSKISGQFAVGSGQPDLPSESCRKRIHQAVKEPSNFTSEVHYVVNSSLRHVPQPPRN